MPRYCGHPVAGDDKYGDGRATRTLAPLGLKRMFLHAHSLAFIWPDGGGEQSFSSPLPTQLAPCLISSAQTCAPVTRRRHGGRAAPRRLRASGSRQFVAQLAQ